MGWFSTAALQTRRGSFYRGGAHLSVLRGDPPPRTDPCPGRFAARQERGEGGGTMSGSAGPYGTRSVTRAMVPSNRSVVRDVRERVLSRHAPRASFERLRARARRVGVPDRRERERRESATAFHRARHDVPLDMPPSSREERSAQNPRDAFRAIFFFRLFVVTFRTVSPRA